MNEDNSEALNTLISSIQEKMGTENTNNNTNNSINNTTPDFSSLLNVLNNTNNNSNTDESNNSNSGFNIDPSILLKIQQIMGAMNNKNPQKDLLLSLKPFLRQSRQDKMNDYLTILSVISIIESLSNKGSD